MAPTLPACLALLLLALPTGTEAASSEATAGDATAAENTSGAVHSSWPTEIDPGARWLIYQHGAIVEGTDPRPVHPIWGVYDFPTIAESFAAAGFEVLAEQRPRGAEADAWATRIVGQVQELERHGVPPARIGLAGHSKGGRIVHLAAAALGPTEVRTVILAGCFGPDPQEAIAGPVLSLREASDDVAGSCRTVLPPGAAEVVLELGNGHGAFYRPDPGWIEPTIAFLGSD